MKSIIDTNLWKKFRDNKLLYMFYRKTLGHLIRESRLIGRKRAIKILGHDYIKEVHELLNNSGILFFVDCGTLLGFVREGRLLSWDYDVDFGLLVEDSSIWIRLEEKLKSAGYIKIRQFSLDGIITEQTYMKKDVSIDFFGHFNLDNCSKQYAYYNPTNHPTNALAVKEFTTVRITSISQININGTFINIPNDVDRFLTDSYGVDWKIPDPKWDDSKSPGMVILSDKKGIKEEYQV